MNIPFAAFLGLALASFLIHPSLLAQAGPNLLTNGSATAPITTGWTVITSGGNTGWTVTGANQDSTGGSFNTSYTMCVRSQTIDLLAKGFTAETLDASPPFLVEEYFKSSFLNNSLPDNYYLKVELRGAAGNVIATWSAGTRTAPLKASSTTVWTRQFNEFRNYGPGVRSIYFEDGGHDTGNWAGSYGTQFDAAYVGILNVPPTALAASRATFPPNTPAGGLVTYFTATDADDSSHTFALVSQATTTFETLISTSATGWRFLDDGVVPTSDWNTLAFNDSTWETGPAPLGYDTAGADTWLVTNTVGFGGNTAAKPFTSYYRKTFTVNDPAAFTALDGTLMIDDGAVVYLNGVEIYRSNLPAAPAAITSTTPATAAIGGTSENDYEAFTVSTALLPGLLVAGVNVLSVEAHQATANSSDLSVDVSLRGTVNTTENKFDNERFEFSGPGLRLKDASGLTPGRSFTVRIRATDSASNPFIQNLTLTVGPTAFTAAPSALIPTPSSLSENTAAVVSFVVTDTDTPDLHTLELVTGPGDTDNTSFTVSGDRLLLATPADYESQNSYAVRLRVTDSVGLSAEFPLTLQVLDNTTEDDDGDGLTEAEEDLNNNGVLDPGETSPIVADTDGDGFSDKVERDNSSDPRDPASVPPAVELALATTVPTGESWLTASRWTGGTALQPFHIGVVGAGLSVRPPAEASPTFPGYALDLRDGGLFRLKHTSGLCSVQRLILRNGGKVEHGQATTTLALGGTGSTTTLYGSAQLDAFNGPLDLQSALSGSGTLLLTSTSTTTVKGEIILSRPASGFTGDIVLTQTTLRVTDPAALGSSRRLLLQGGIFRPETSLDLPGIVVRLYPGSKLVLANTLTFGGLMAGTKLIAPGTYDHAGLIAEGVPADLLEDLGGDLIIPGSLATTDSDGDGTSDAAELAARTNPLDPNDFLRLSLPTPGPANSYTLSCQTVPGESYALQYRLTSDTTWTTLQTVTATTNTVTFSDTTIAPAHPHVLYRLTLP